MPIYEICEYARTHGIIPRPGFQPVKIHFGIIIREDGSILVEPIGGKEGRSFTCPFLTPDELKIARPKVPPPTSGCPGSQSRQFLWDSVDVILDQAQQWKHQSFLDFLDRAAKDGVQDVSKIAETIRTKLPEIKFLLEACKAKPVAKVTFNVGGRWVVENKDWHEWWAAERARINSLRHKSDRLMISVASGEEVPPERVQQPIKGLVAGAMSQGAKLASWDKEAFQSYGLSGGEHAPMSEMEERSFNIALHELLRRGVSIPGASIAFWYQNCDDSIENEVQRMIVSAYGNTEALEEQKIAALKSLLEAIESGRRPLNADASYYMLVLSAVESRLMIRSFRIGNVLDMLRSVNKWFDDTTIMTERGPSRPMKLAKYLYTLFVPQKPSKKASDYVPSHSSYMLFESSIGGNAIPPSLQYRAILKYSSLLHATSPEARDSGMSPDLVAILGILKAILIRKGHPMSDVLNPHHQSVSYHCGRLLASYEEAQRVAIPGVGSTMAESAWSAILNSPLRMFPKALKIKNLAHIRKIRGDNRYLAARLESQAAEICEQIANLGSFPQTQNNDQQGEFILGFESQRVQINKDRQAAFDAAKARKAERNRKEETQS